MRTLFAPGMVLEPLLARHAQAMYAVLSDPALYEFENSPPPSEDWLRTRYRRLEQRGPADATERWLNWVVRLDTGAGTGELAGEPAGELAGELAGYVQASVLPDATARIAYELNSRHWRQGIGGRAVAAVLAELRAAYGTQQVFAVLKTANFRSMGLLHKLGFVQASPADVLRHRDGADETVLFRLLHPGKAAAPAG